MRRPILSFALAAVLAATALAQSAAEVYCGSFICFRVRASAGGQDPQTRANRAMDVINKYLGGKPVTVTQRPQGSDIRLMVQRDVIITVTAADAKAEKAKSVKALAAQWAGRLNRAFRETSAQK